MTSCATRRQEFGIDRNLSSTAIEAGDAECVGRPTSFPEAGAAHAIEHLLGSRKTLDGGRQISVRTFDAGDHGADRRQYAFEVDAIGFADEATGLAEVEDAALSSGAQDPQDFT